MEIDYVGAQLSPFNRYLLASLYHTNYVPMSGFSDSDSCCCNNPNPRMDIRPVHCSISLNGLLQLIPSLLKDLLPFCPTTMAMLTHLDLLTNILS